MISGFLWLRSVSHFLNRDILVSTSVQIVYNLVGQTILIVGGQNRPPFVDSETSVGLTSSSALTAPQHAREQDSQYANLQYGHVHANSQSENYQEQ